MIDFMALVVTEHEKTMKASKEENSIVEPAFTKPRIRSICAFSQDCRFLVRSDHANLRLLHAESDKKIIQWVITFQSNDFDIQHIAGKDNEVADGCSPDVNENGKRDNERAFTENERGEWGSSDPIGLINLLEGIDFAESPCVISKVFIAFHSKLIEILMELFAMTVTYW